MSESWGDPVKRLDAITRSVLDSKEVKKIPVKKFCPLHGHEWECLQDCAWAVPHSLNSGEWRCAVWLMSGYLKLIEADIDELKPQKCT